MCLSAITWAGFDNFIYLFSYEESRDLFAIPHDLNILNQVFNIQDGNYKKSNQYWTSYSIDEILNNGKFENLKLLKQRTKKIKKCYDELSELYQQTKAILNPESLKEFLTDKIINLGTAACPPYHLAIVIGGTSAESTLKTVKAASVRDLDELPTTGDVSGHGWRDLEWEKIVLEMTRKMGIGAQFGGKYFCHDVRVIRLPRHGASCPIGIGVSCSADRQIRAKINSKGLFIEKLETDPARFLPTVKENLTTPVVAIDLQKPMPKILEALSQHPIKTRVNLTGTMIVARDIAHAKLLDVLETKGTLPEYVKNHPIYYAGPAKTPAGMASGSFGPTTAGRMDTYVDRFQAAGGSMIMLAKGNRSGSVREACAKYGGFYLGSIGGAAAKLALESIKHIEILEYSELGMEAIWKIEVENFPAFIVIDDKGNDFYNRGI